MQAALDGDTLTARRTAAASALAADYLGRKDARNLLIVGTGQISLAVAAAQCTLRSYTSVWIWGRRSDKAAVFVDQRARASLAGDLAQPPEAGRITPEHIRADLVELCQGAHRGRNDKTDRTAFKSAGTALHDLAARRFTIWRRPLWPAITPFRDKALKAPARYR